MSSVYVRGVVVIVGIKNAQYYGEQGWRFIEEICKVIWGLYRQAGREDIYYAAALATTLFWRFSTRGLCSMVYGQQVFFIKARRLVGGCKRKVKSAIRNHGVGGLGLDVLKGLRRSIYVLVLVYSTCGVINLGLSFRFGPYGSKYVSLLAWDWLTWVETFACALCSAPSP